MLVQSDVIMQKLFAVVQHETIGVTRAMRKRVLPIKSIMGMVNIVHSAQYIVTLQKII